MKIDFRRFLFVVLLLAICAQFASTNELGNIDVQSNHLTPCPPSNTSVECKIAAEACYLNCERGQGHGAGFCATFSAFMGTVVNTILTDKFGVDSESLELALTDSLWWSASYYCTSGAPYMACNYCGSKMAEDDILRVQNETLDLIGKMPMESGKVLNQTTVLNVSFGLTNSWRDLGSQLPSSFITRKVFTDIEILKFKFDLVTLDDEGVVEQDFAYRHFLEAAKYPGKESIFGIHKRFKDLLLGRKTPSSNLYLGGYLSQSILERYPTEMCQMERLEYLYLTLFEVRRMLFFVLLHDRVNFDDKKYEDALAESHVEQKALDETIRTLCSVDVKSMKIFSTKKRPGNNF